MAAIVHHPDGSISAELFAEDDSNETVSLISIEAVPVIGGFSVTCADYTGEVSDSNDVEPILSLWKRQIATMVALKGT